MEAFTYKGIADGKYVTGDIEAINQDEASHKLKEQKIIITNILYGKWLIWGVTDVHPIIGGIAPAAPPITMLSDVVLFNQKV